jgi:two-component system, NarL family, invasion response regulator UvrY
MIKILLADDHSIVRSGLKTYIEKIIPHSAIEEASDGDAVFEKIRLGDYDLIILDINMPPDNSFDLVSNILTVKPRTRILMFSMSPEEIYAKKYLSLGALGYLNKDASAVEIEQAINLVLKNRRYLSPSLTQALTESALGKNPNNQNPFNLLSPRELEIARHLMRGESVSEIGECLHLHTSTIGTHKARIFQKLHCKNIMELNELAILHNFIPG